MRAADFERLFSDHAKPLFAFLAYRCGDRGLAEDVLADTFERALRARTRFDRRKASEKTWLYSIALNLLRDHARRGKAERGATERIKFERGTEAPDPNLGRVEDADVVGKVLGALSAEEREAVALRFGADLTVPEIAELTGNSLTTMEGRVYRALRKLRAELEGPAS